jgi:hypothetical protein
MSKLQFLDLSEADRRILFERTESATGIRRHMVEKDAWVYWTLGQLFALPEAHEHFIFKGGTSLSKVWKVIQRFSEDIDISLSREWLGFTAERDPEAANSRKQRSRLLEELSFSCGSKLHDEVAPSLRQKFAMALGQSGWTLEIAADDPQTLLFQYPSVFRDASSAQYVRPIVKIECGARSDRWPVAEQSIASYVSEAFPSVLDEKPIMVPVLDIGRTFWEKATILHAEAHRPTDKTMPDRFSRHYADLAALAQHPAGFASVARKDLRCRVVAHKQVFFPAAWASYETACPGSFKLIPSEERLATLEADYRAMQDMYFRTPLSWPEIVAILTTLEAQINASD